MSSRRLSVLSLAFAMVAVGCGISGSGRAQRIDPVPLGLGDTIAASTTSTTVVPDTTAAQATSTSDNLATTTTTIPTELVSLYFISASGLTPLKRPLAANPSGDQVLALLAKGPPADDQLGAGLRSVIPSARDHPLMFKSDGTGVATIDLPSNFLDSMQPGDQRFAFAQIVLTVISNIKGIGQVRFTLDGVQTTVLNGNGAEVAPGTPVSLRDYLNLIGDSPPAQSTTTTTTTTTTASSTTTTTVAAPPSTAAPEVVAQTTLPPPGT